MVEYIIHFHDNRDLYCDVTIRVRDLGNNTYEHIYIYYKNNAKSVVLDSFNFEDDGNWELKSVDRLDEMNTLYFEIKEN